MLIILFITMIVLMFIYNKELRRTAMSLLNSYQQIIQLFLFFMLMTLFWALIAIKVIGDLDGEAEYDHLLSNYTDLGTSFTILYVLSSPDGYPECMLPAYEVSSFYLIFFLTFIILF